MPNRPIVVGYDGSEGADAAIAWALEDGARTGTRVSLVYALEWRSVAPPLGLAPAVWLDESAREDAQRLVAGAVASARQTHPDVTVSGTVLDGAATAVLVDKSHEARLIVLGARGEGGFAGLLVGSTSVTVSAHAHCPVVVVRGDQRAGAPVVVGFDGSDSAYRAVEFGFAQAAAMDTSLQLVYAWAPPQPRWQPPQFDLQEQVSAEHAALEEILAGWRGKYPQVSSSVQVITGPPALSLVELSGTAQLVVVGSRGRGGFRGMLLGSISQQLLHHALCPVAVVRELAN